VCFCINAYQYYNFNVSTGYFMTDSNDNQGLSFLLYNLQLLPRHYLHCYRHCPHHYLHHSHCYLLNLHYHRLKFQYCLHHCPYILRMKLLCNVHLLHLILLLIYYLYHLLFCYHHVLQDLPQQTLRISCDVLLQSKKKKT
jgi:hypothetical protein